MTRNCLTIYAGRAGSLWILLWLLKATEKAGEFVRAVLKKQCKHWRRAVELLEAVSFYRCKGYKSITVPTVVEGRVVNATCPPWGDFRPDHGLYHVASAEQSFLQMMEEGYDLLGLYQATTACHRPSDADRGELYQEWFLKLELYSSDVHQGEELLLTDARECYAKHLNVPLEEIEVVPTELGRDLVFNGVEVGSYGIRLNVLGRHSWAYGTGFVPFRLGKAMEKDGRLSKVFAS